MKRKAFISFILTLLMIILNINICYCSALEIITGINAAYNYVNNVSSVQDKKDAIRNWIYKNSEAAGFMFDLTTFNPTADFLINLLPDDIVESLGSNPSEEAVIDAVQDFILDNQTVSNNSIVNDHSVNVFIENFANYYSSNNPQIGYTYNLQLSSGNGMSASIKAGIAKLCNEYPDFVILVYQGNYSNDLKAFCYKNDGNIYGVFSSTSGTNRLVKLYLAKSENNVITVGKFSATNDNFYSYTWDNSISDFVIDENGTIGELDYIGYLSTQKDVGLTVGSFNNAPSFYNKNICEIPIFGSVALLEEYVNNIGVGKYPYYYNNSVWSNFSSSTGDYVVDNSNVNTVTYGDVISYVNDYHDTNNNYPDNSTVNTWIETTNNNNNSGGGSGGGSGGSGSDDSGSIFDWLKTLGKAIGDLISGVGNFLSEIVAGLVDAITNLLDAITTLITGVLESLTNIFSGLIEFIFAGLPDDIRNVLSLALTVAILISVLKLIRGN